jgi:hypothetical protein
VEATLQLFPGWHEGLHGEIRPNGKLFIDYDPDRLPYCRMTWRGALVWKITAYIRFHPGGQAFTESTLDEIRDPPGHGMIVDLVPRRIELAVPADAQRVEMWFLNDYRVSSTCESWDSRFGQNYWYEVMRD